jgi:hypothetical protein
MKPFTLILSIALAAVTVASDVTPASATRMNGKCCQSSDGGRSFRYRNYSARRLIPHTCSGYAAACIRVSRTRSEPDGASACLAAKAMCMRTGVHVGPFSGIQYAGMERR